jgi:hypothetical protein
MSRILRALPLALLALALPLACTTDDAEDATAGESGSHNDTSASSAASDETASSDDSAVLGCAAEITFDTTDGASNPIMQTWGAACTTNADCVALIGDPDAICDTMAVVYELPGGYCTKECSLPDLDTRAIPDAPDCDPNGGVTCLGVMGTFERCGVPCSDDMQCNRAGYECRQMPLISMPEDPNFCLMPDCCQESCIKD